MLHSVDYLSLYFKYSELVETFCAFYVLNRYHYGHEGYRLFLDHGQLSLEHEILFCKTDFSFTCRKIVIRYNNNIIIMIMRKKTFKMYFVFINYELSSAG